VRGLTDALRRHNSREEVLLRDITVDAWGAARDRVMTEEHVQEHAELYAAIVGIPREEQLFLGEDTLRDDGVVVEIDG
jgi:hypothetical protein